MAEEEISIKVTIADLVFPLRTTLAEEESVRLAAREVNEKFKEYRQVYQIADKHHLLAMVALQVATELQSLKKEQQQVAEHVAQLVADMQQVLIEENGGHA